MKRPYFQHLESKAEQITIFTAFQSLEGFHNVKIKKRRTHQLFDPLFHVSRNQVPKKLKHKLCIHLSEEIRVSVTFYQSCKGEALI